MGNEFHPRIRLGFLDYGWRVRGCSHDEEVHVNAHQVESFWSARWRCRILGALKLSTGEGKRLWRTVIDWKEQG